MQPKKRALGRGLSALLPPVQPAGPSTTQTSPVMVAAETEGDAERQTQIEIARISPNSYQPRDVFDETALDELAASIREHGVIQPVVVTKRGANYMLVAGERRWRAARKAGLEQIPAVVLDLDDKQVLEFALVENLQRENLSSIEEARAYKVLIDTFGLSQEEVADRVGKGRPTVANALRLLRLPHEFQSDLENGALTAGHARAILSLTQETDQKRLRDTIVREKLSVREAERLAVELVTSKQQRKPKHQLDPNIQKLREQLIEALTCRVAIKTFDHNKGKIEIYYDSLDELERVLMALGIEL